VSSTVEDRQVTFAADVTAGPKKAPRTHRVQVTCRTIEGTFPNFRALLPDGGVPLTVDAGLLSAAVKRVATLAGPNIPVALSAVGGTLTVSASSQELGEASAEVPAVGDGWPTWSVNPALLLAGVAAVVPSGVVTLRGRDGIKPWMVTAEASPVDALLMPMRVS